MRSKEVVALFYRSGDLRRPSKEYIFKCKARINHPGRNIPTPDKLSVYSSFPLIFSRTHRPSPVIDKSDKPRL